MDDQRQEQLTQLGIEPEAAKAWIEQQTPLETDEDGEVADCGVTSAPLCVWPENVPAVRLFLQLQTQWRVRPSGRLQGLRYTEAEAAMRLMGLKNRAELFDQLVDMEHAVLGELRGD